MDDDGLSRLIPKPLKPFKSTDEYIYAMKEDLAYWFNGLYATDLTADTLLQQLEDGVLLCRHANSVCGYICAANGRATEVVFRSSVKPKTFQARDNIANFIAWLRGNLGMKDTVLFETDDLVLNKNEKNVVLSLLELARRGARYGMPAPMLVQFEQEIERADSSSSSGQSEELRRQRCYNNQTLDELVRSSLSKCTCPSQFPLVQISPGKYKFGDNQTTVFVRVLRSHVMIRVGGGWDTLERYLDKHDPCRCRAYSHRRGSLPVVEKALKVLPSKFSVEAKTSERLTSHRTSDAGYRTSPRETTKKPGIHKGFYSTLNLHESSQQALRRQGHAGSTVSLFSNGNSRDIASATGSGRSTPRDRSSSSLLVCRDQSGRHRVAGTSSTPPSPSSSQRPSSPAFFSTGSRPCSPARRRINRINKDVNHRRSTSEPCETLPRAADARPCPGSPSRQVFGSVRKDKVLGARPTRIPVPLATAAGRTISPDRDPALSKWTSSTMRKVDSGVEMTSDDSDASQGNCAGSQA